MRHAAFLSCSSRKMDSPVNTRRSCSDLSPPGTGRRPASVEGRRRIVVEPVMFVVVVKLPTEVPSSEGRVSDEDGGGGDRASDSCDELILSVDDALSCSTRSFN